MGDDYPMQCPECGEDAISQPPGDLVPWDAHGIAPPAWSHRDGSSLCPVIGRSGGYEPTQPQLRNADRALVTPRLQAPATSRVAGQAAPADGPAFALTPQGDQRTTDLPAGTVGVIGREHMKAVIARLGVLGRQAAAKAPEFEPEAGA